MDYFNDGLYKKNDFYIIGLVLMGDAFSFDNP
jgi:hypothetical protein